MNNRNVFLLAFVLISGGLVSKNANAFYCLFNNVYVPSPASLQIPPPNLKRDTQGYVTLIDLSQSVSCLGNSLDNLRLNSASINPALANYGFIGSINFDGTRVDMPTSGQYIWPYVNSSGTISGGGAPLRLSIELRKSTNGTAWPTGLTLPAGTIIATLAAVQRSGGVWGASYPTWNLVLSAPLVIPAYTCNVTNTASHRVSLPDVDRSELRGIGKGIFTRSRTRFSIDLACEAMATVDMSIDGTKMTGKEDVLANLESGNDNIGIKVFPADNTTTPVVFDGSTNEVFESAAANESFAYDAYYYYDGGRFFPGNVRAQMTYTFTYR